MSNPLRSNRLAIIIAAVLGVVGFSVLFVTLLGGGPGVLRMGRMPEAPTPDADSPATVIKTLSGQVEAMREQNTKLQEETGSLKEAFGSLQASLDGLLERPDRPASADHGDALSQMTQTLGQLNARINALETDAPTRGPTSIPLDAEDPVQMVWIEPLDADAHTPDDSALQPVAFNALASLNASPQAPGATLDTRSSGAPARGPQQKPEPVPYYTIPADSTLMNATAWTALLGRVPVNGQVRDPWRFKVLTGADNLAANGIHIPNLTGMIWSGIAVGDLALRCSRGELYSVTYVFSDGSINTVKGESDTPLAWISDASGIPCVPGELKTNAPAFLATRTALLAMEAGARAYADAETTRRVDPLGGSNTTVTGDAGRYALGEALAGGSQEIGNWFRERQRQSFDAIFVPPGTLLTLNVETMIPIDKDPNGRKVSYHRRKSGYRTPTLD